MSIGSDFKAFVMRGNVIDLAVGVIIGAAFGKIVTSAVEDIIMPPVGILVGDIDFSKLAITLKHAVGDQPAVAIHYGLFINTVINFLIVASCIFVGIKVVSSMQRKEAAAPPPPAPPTKEEVLLGEIRDILKTQR